MNYLLLGLLACVGLTFTSPVFATTGPLTIMDISPLHPAALLCLAVFVMSYALVLLEEKINLRKSKPVMLGAAVIWIIIAWVAPDYGIDHHALNAAISHGLTEYGSLLLFLITAMTYINALEDRNVFAALRCKLVRSRFNMRQLFWATGFMAFFLSPVADNLTTAMILGTVIMTVGRNDPRFIVLACINVVNAANAGGAFSPFGDITTLMVWQAGKVEFLEFFQLFLPCLICFMIPALIMNFFVTTDYPDPVDEDVPLKFGARRIMVAGACTIAMAVSLEQALGLPPFLGMMAGLSILMMIAYQIRYLSRGKNDNKFHIFSLIQGAEWDTLLFFYGVIFSVSGLGILGYMELASTTMYDGFGASFTNISIGVISALVDNIPVMFAVLSMNPEMSHFQWLLVTLTAGVGGSLLSIGSAAGIAMMGIAHGHYTFLKHLKWMPVLGLGYIAAIAAHFIING